MYTVEEIKLLIGFMIFSLLGRLLFYRDKWRTRKTFKEKVKCRLLSWVWEIPILLFFGLIGIAVMDRWGTSFTEAGLTVAFLAYMGLETIKIFFYDWLNTRISRKEKKWENGDD